MNLFIDAFNIRSGGGLTHLRETLNHCDPVRYGIDKVFVCANENTLTTLTDRKWLVKLPAFEAHPHVGARLLWQQTRLRHIIDRVKPDIFFSPGGIVPFGIDRPLVAMSQNLQPFDSATIRMYDDERPHKRFKMMLRYFLIRQFQKHCFKKADGIIFLTNHGRNVVIRSMGGVRARIAVIPHGISHQFLHRPREPQPLEFYSDERPYKFIYVSTISVYKHQWHVARAIASLREEGLPVAVDFIGPAIAGLDRLESEIQRAGKHAKYIRYIGAIPYERLKFHYEAADGFVFASTCETFGQVLLEAMISGLPVACSHYQPMMEIVGQAAVFFDPTNPADISRSLKRLLTDGDLSRSLSREGFEKAKSYSWESCVHQTFGFITDIFEKR